MTDGPLILAVEDDERSAALLRAVLEGAGYQLLLVSTLADARAQLIGTRPDLVVLDIGLPDGSGLTLARELRASPVTADVPIVVASARVLAADRELVDQAGSNIFLAKPLRPSVLLEAVAESLRPSQA